LGLNDTINREALAGKAQAKLSYNPPLAATVAVAVRSCPEPPELKVRSFQIELALDLQLQYKFITFCK
jgi:hypothetical protein